MRRLSPAGLGFGRCDRCPYRETGTPSICYECAGDSMEALSHRRCQVCDLPLTTPSCGNPICNWEDRWFDRNHSIAMRSGVIEGAIKRYKYYDKIGWSLIFARVLLGFLDENREGFEDFDMILPSPTFLDGSQGRTWHHTRRVLRDASTYAEQDWPFDLGDPPSVIKTAATPAMAGLPWARRNELAQTELRAALHVPDPGRTKGKAILVYDDIFTDGQTLNEVARCLRVSGGAASVSGLSLARQPWRGRG